MYGTPRSGGPTGSPRTITARPTTSPGWSGHSTRPCARWTSAAASDGPRLLGIRPVDGSHGQLNDRQQVALAVLEPGRAVVDHPGDTRRLVEAWEVILFEAHAALLEI